MNLVKALNKDFEPVLKKIVHESNDVNRLLIIDLEGK